MFSFSLLNRWCLLRLLLAFFASFWKIKGVLLVSFWTIEGVFLASFFLEKDGVFLASWLKRPNTPFRMEGHIYQKINCNLQQTSGSTIFLQLAFLELLY